MKMFLGCKHYFGRHKMMIFLCTFLSIIAALVAIGFPLITGNFIDNLVKECDINFVFLFCIKFAILSSFSLIISYALERLNTKLQLSISYSFNIDVINHVQTLPMSYFVGKDLAYLNQIINSDTNAVILFCVSVFQNTICNVITTTILTIVCFALNPTISTVFFLLCIIYIFAYIAIHKKAYQVNYALKESQSIFFGKLYEQLNHIKFIKSSGTIDEYRERMNDPYKSFKGSTLNSQKFFFLFSGLENTVSLLIQIIVYILGAMQIIKGNFSVGGFTIFISYFSSILGKVRYYFNFGKAYQEAMVSWARISQIMSEKAEPSGSIYLKGIREIEISNMVLSYGDPKELCERTFELKVSHLQFEKGKLYCLWGKNGTGKTTFINTLMGLNNNIVKDGMLCYNHVDIKAADLKSLRKYCISASDQTPQILMGSLRENLFWGVKITDRVEGQASYLSKKFGISQLFDSDIGVDLTMLSGGEKQKISLIRALLKSADVFIFDEPTTALDISSKKFLLEILTQLKKNKIIIVVSHDEQVRDICDSLICFDDVKGVYEL